VRARSFAIIAVLAAVLVPNGPGHAAGRPASRSDCVWHRHTKRVVVHIRRHGHIQRVVRIRHWWTCDPAPPPPPARLGVQSFEFHYILSRASVPAGQLIVELSNRGEDDHNLNILREGSDQPPIQLPDTSPGQRRSQTLTVAPGTYRLWCSLPQHEALGMQTTLTVAAAA